MQLLKEEYSYLAVLLINMKENLISWIMNVSVKNPFYETRKTTQHEATTFKIGFLRTWTFIRRAAAFKRSQFRPTGSQTRLLWGRNRHSLQGYVLRFKINSHNLKRQFPSGLTPFQMYIFLKSKRRQTLFPGWT
jgi:hypothetical protein